ncbi:UvrD-helicase domain-containing protein [Candidatus Gracilibacteria bacterium]|nr:UvrD-helicase domain-containing protein [Candidatus Gracilibacteria bacterium]
MKKILEGLNDKQLQATTSLRGSTLVIAGAGSGKTSVLTRRLAYLIHKGVMPGNILSLTFTNKAAAEMNSRVRNLLSQSGLNLPQIPVWQQDYTQSPLLCTFHSLGVRLLREFGSFLELRKEFTIIDSDEQKKIIKKILKELNISDKNLHPSLAQYFISQCKQELLTSQNSRKVSKEFLAVFHRIYAKYEETLQASQAVDFDDLILKTYLLLNNYQEVREIINTRWSHIMVDEFQDTNPAQFEVIKLLAPKHLLQSSLHHNHINQYRSLFVVGDDAQSIYGFRGSKVEIILNFENEYEGTTEVILNQNYRSVQPILNLAEKIIDQNPFQKKKELFTQNKDQIDVHYYLANNERDEAEYILRTLKKLYHSNSSENFNNYQEEETQFIPDDIQDIPTPKQPTDPVSSMFDVYLDSADFSPSPISATTSTYNDYSAFSKINWHSIKELDQVVILYRTHSQSRSIEEIFLKNNVPYRLVSGVRFLERREIKDTLTILKYLSNSDDKISLSRFLPLVIEGVGPKTLQKMLAYLEDFNYPLAPKHINQLMELLNKIQSVWSQNTSLIDLTKNILVVTGYMRYLKKEFPAKEEFQTRVDNISELYSIMFPFDQDQLIPLQDRLNQFLAQVMLMTSQELSTENDTPKINLMSLHQSKGLEFETVFLVGVEDGLLPHSNSFIEPKGLEEEIRLSYVGVTRAKKHLYLISADSRIQYGQIKANPMSRIFRPFIDTYVKRDV